MKHFLIIGFFCFCTDSLIAQNVSSKDSLLLINFWGDFQTGIINKDKVLLSTICDFPFYCRPCVDHTQSKNEIDPTVKVTKKLFLDNEYKIFFEDPLKGEIVRFKEQRQMPILLSEGHFMLVYTIVKPSPEWEGAQGYIYIKKIAGKFKITGIEIIP